MTIDAQTPEAPPAEPLDLDALEAEAQRRAAIAARIPTWDSNRNVHRYAWERPMLALIAEVRRLRARVKE